MHRCSCASAASLQTHTHIHTYTLAHAYTYSHSHSHTFAHTHVRTQALQRSGALNESQLSALQRGLSSPLNHSSPAPGSQWMPAPDHTPEQTYPQQPQHQHQQQQVQEWHTQQQQQQQQQLLLQQQASKPPPFGIEKEDSTSRLLRFNQPSPPAPPGVYWWCVLVWWCVLIWCSVLVLWRVVLLLIISIVKKVPRQLLFLDLYVERFWTSALLRFHLPQCCQLELSLHLMHSSDLSTLCLHTLKWFKLGCLIQRLFSCFLTNQVVPS